MTDKAKYSYHVWITMPPSSYESAVVSKLVSKGYIVSAGDGSKTTLISGPDSASVLIALKVEIVSMNKHSSADTHLDVQTILQGLGGKYYSIVVSEFTSDCMWCSSNMKSGDDKTVPTSGSKLN